MQEKKKTPPKFVLFIDAKNFVWRAIGSQKIPLVNPRTGRDISGVWNAFRMLRNILEQWQPETTFMVWEGPTPEAKRALLPEYKTFRQTDPKRVAYMEKYGDRVNACIPDVKRLCEFAGVVNVEIPDTEADDVIASFCYNKEFLAGYKKVALTTDKDFLHLCDESMVHLQGKQDFIVNKENFGIALKYRFRLRDEVIFPWEGFLLFQSLMGDSGDDVGGYEGIGDKTAANITHTLWCHIGSERLRDFDEVKAALLKIPLDEIPRNISNKIQFVADRSALLAFNWMFFNPHTWLEMYVDDLVANEDFIAPSPDFREFPQFCDESMVVDRILFAPLFERHVEKTMEVLNGRYSQA